MSGDYAYVIGYQGDSLTILDISNKEHPYEIGNYDSSHHSYSEPFCVAISNNYAFLGISFGLDVVDITIKDEIEEVGIYLTSDSIDDVILEEQYAYVSDDVEGLVILDITNLNTPTKIGNNSENIKHACGLVKNGNYVYMAVYDSSFLIFNVEDKSNPQYIGRYDTTGYTESLVVRNDYVFLAAGKTGLDIVDVSDKSNPQLVGNYDTESTTKRIVISGNYAYLAIDNSDLQGDDNGLVILDISDKENPQYIGGYDTGDARDVVVQGEFAYVAGKNGLTIVDVSDKENPISVGRYDEIGYAWRVTVKGNFAYISYHSRGLVIVDISDNTNPRHAGNFTTFDITGAVEIKDNNLFVADRNGGLRILKFRDSIQLIPIVNPNDIRLEKSGIIAIPFQVEIDGIPGNDVEIEFDIEDIGIVKVTSTSYYVYEGIAVLVLEGESHSSDSITVTISHTCVYDGTILPLSTNNYEFTIPIYERIEYISTGGLKLGAGGSLAGGSVSGEGGEYISISTDGSNIWEFNDIYTGKVALGVDLEAIDLDLGAISAKAGIGAEAYAYGSAALSLTNLNNQEEIIQKILSRMILLAATPLLGPIAPLSGAAAIRCTKEISEMTDFNYLSAGLGTSIEASLGASVGLTNKKEMEKNDLSFNLFSTGVDASVDIHGGFLYHEDGSVSIGGEVTFATSAHATTFWAGGNIGAGTTIGLELFYDSIDDIALGKPQSLTFSIEISRDAYFGLDFSIGTGESGFNFASVATDMTKDNWEKLKLSFTFPIGEYRDIIEANTPELVEKFTSLDFNILPTVSNTIINLADVPISYEVMAVETKSHGIHLGAKILGTGINIGFDLDQEIKYPLERGFIKYHNGQFGKFNIASYERPALITWVLDDYISTQYDLNNLFFDTLNDFIAPLGDEIKKGIDWIAAKLTCPANITITNSQGQSIGIIDGGYSNNISGAEAYYLNGSEVEMFLLPNNDTYNIVISGHEEGTYNLSLVGLGNNTSKTLFFSGSELMNNSIDIIHINENLTDTSISSDIPDKTYTLKVCTVEYGAWKNSTITNLTLSGNETHKIVITEESNIFTADRDGDGEFEIINMVQGNMSGDEALNLQPTAIIDFISPGPILNTEVIHFIGKWSDDGVIVRYVWRSSIDGEFYNNTNTEFNNSNLSNGIHTLYFKVQDDLSGWSDEVSETLIIHTKPIAEIESIIPYNSKEGENVQFKGIGTDDGTIDGYSWRSSLDGELYNGSLNNFEASNVSVGTHTIYLRVQDNYGVWSDEVISNITVVEEDNDEEDGIGVMLPIVCSIIITVGIGGFLLWKKQS